VIVPSILAIRYLVGQSINSHLISRFQFIASSYLASNTGSWRNDICTRPNFGNLLRNPDHSNKFLPVHQLVRVVLYDLSVPVQSADVIAYTLSLGINQMFNVIIRSVHLYFFCFTDNIYLARASHQQ
jgi:hypothetical protein